MTDVARDAEEAPVAIVVGASSGMGRATALAFHAAGWRVMAAARRADRLLELTAHSQNRIQTCVTDVTDRAQVDDMIAATVALWGRVDALVYATGANLPQRSVSQLTPDNWNRLLATNLTGAFHCTQAVLPTLRIQGNGLIIYVSTAAVQRPDVSGVAYQASKHGLTGLAHGTRVEERGHGIRTTVFPGLCDTEILQQRPIPTPEEILAQALQPEDVAAAVLFVAQLPPRASVPELQLLPHALS